MSRPQIIQQIIPTTFKSNETSQKEDTKREGENEDKSENEEVLE